MPNEECHYVYALSCTVCPNTGCQSVSKVDDQYCSLFTTPGTDQRETVIVTVGHLPALLCLPDVIARDKFPLYFHTVNDWVLAVGLVWEQGQEYLSAV